MIVVSSKNLVNTYKVASGCGHNKLMVLVDLTAGGVTVVFGDPITQRAFVQPGPVRDADGLSLTSV